MAQKYNLDLYEFKELLRWGNISNEFENYLADECLNISSKALSVYATDLQLISNPDFSRSYIKYYQILREDLIKYRNSELLEYIIKLIVSKIDMNELTKYSKYDYQDSRSLEYMLRPQDKAILLNAYQKIIETEFERRNFDYEKTNLFLDWNHSNKTRDEGSDIVAAPPISIGDQVYFIKSNTLYTLSNVSKNRKDRFTITFKGEDKLKLSYLSYNRDNYDAIILKNRGK